MRTFIAIELPTDVKERLKGIQETLRKTDSDVKWVDPNNIHLTLKFLGEVSEEKIPVVKAAIKRIAQQNSPYPLSISGIGAFPRISSPRVIWAGVRTGENETARIAEQLEEDFSAMGFPKEERKFSCHITLGRIRSSAGIQRLVKLLTDSGAALLPENLGFFASAITLFQSRLSPQGPAYEPLSVFQLEK